MTNPKAILPVPQTFFGTHTVSQYPESEPENINKKMTAKETANAELHSLLFGPKM